MVISDLSIILYKAIVNIVLTCLLAVLHFLWSYIQPPLGLFFLSLYSSFIISSKSSAYPHTQESIKHVNPKQEWSHPARPFANYSSACEWEINTSASICGNQSFSICVPSTIPSITYFFKFSETYAFCPLKWVSPICT